MKVIINGIEYLSPHNIGDKILIKKGDGTDNPYTSKFYLDEKDENIVEEHPVRWTIEDIIISAKTGKMTYKIGYVCEKCMFPRQSMSITEDKILTNII